jgi:biotin transport system permease protein
MSNAGLFAAHVPGTSLLHRTPLWPKLGGVLVVGVMAWLVDSVWAFAVVTLVLAAFVILARLPVRRLLRSMGALLPVLVVLLAFQWWSRDLAYAARVVLGIANAYVAAGILTATTSVTELLDAVVRAARPLRRVVDPEVVALTLGIVVRSVPWVAGSFSTVRQSARARGLDRNPRAVVVPTVVHVVAFARATGEALAARGLTDRPEDELPSGATDGGPRSAKERRPPDPPPETR